MPNRSRPDHYSRRARSEGYRARSVYKLEELDTRFGLVRSGARVLDLGAAPGSWSQYAARKVGPAGLVLAIDLQEMPALEGITNVQAITADLFAASTAETIREHGPFDLVMSDAAPRTTGNRTVDTARSAALVEEVLAMCSFSLRAGGSFVAKVFQGGDEQALLAQTRDWFETGRLIKPKASRTESFETFLVGIGFAAEREPQ
jgi:23S rRNA (uridine2552-2'-O)-methyltransferase